MTEPRAPDRDALEAALAARIAGAGLARYNPTGVYTPTGLPAVLFGKLPDKPDAAILINVYNEDYSRDYGSPDLYVQLRFRTPGQDKRTTNALAHSVFLLLHFDVDESNQVWSGLNILNCRRTIAGPVELDGNNRYSRPDSYRITVNPS
jgi:hypothetical protein